MILVTILRESKGNNKIIEKSLNFIDKHIYDVLSSTTVMLQRPGRELPIQCIVAHNTQGKAELAVIFSSCQGFHMFYQVDLHDIVGYLVKLLLFFVLGALWLEENEQFC